MKFLYRFKCFLVALLGFSLHAAEFTISYQEVPDVAQKDVQKAAEIWQKCLVSDPTIKIRVSWIKRGPTGFAVPRAVRNLPHLPIQNVWYPTALANSLQGKRDSELDDMNIFLRDKPNWYYSSESSIAEDQVDFINVVLHEIAHGLGLSSTSFVPWQGERVGSFGLPNDYVNFFKYSFALHEFDGTAAVYDSMLVFYGNKKFADFDNPSLALGEAINDASVYFDGKQARLRSGLSTVKVVPGNLTHIPAMGKTNPIMLPDSGKGESIHKLDSILLGMLEDLGWTIDESCF